MAAVLGLLRGLFVVCWICLYFVPLVGAFFRWWRLDPSSVAAYAIVAFLNNFAPAACIWYLEHFSESIELKGRTEEWNVAVHAALAFATAVGVLAWGVTLLIVRGTTGGWRAAFIVLVLGGCGMVVHAGVNAKDFWRKQAFSAGARIRWIWPSTIAAPVNYWRVALGIVLFVIGLLTPLGS